MMTKIGPLVEWQATPSTDHVMNECTRSRETVHHDNPATATAAACSHTRGTVHCPPTIFEAARPISGANANGSRLIANGGVGTRLTSLRLGHSTGTIREQRPCTEL
jgi:hypothetical protein